MLLYIFKILPAFSVFLALILNFENVKNFKVPISTYMGLFQCYFVTLRFSLLSGSNFTKHGFFFYVTLSLQDSSCFRNRLVSFKYYLWDLKNLKKFKVQISTYIFFFGVTLCIFKSFLWTLNILKTAGFKFWNTWFFFSVTLWH